MYNENFWGKRKIRRKMRRIKRNQTIATSFACILVFISLILFVNFQMNRTYEVKISDVSTHRIFFVLPDGNTYAINVDNGYEFDIGENILIQTNMLADPEYRHCYLVEE